MKTIGVAALLLAGCSGGEPATNRGDPAHTQAPAPTPTSTLAPSRPVGANAVEEKTADFTFAYRYPAAAARYPALASYLDGERQKLRSATVKESAGDRAAAARAGNPFHPHEATVAWQVVTETPRFLSLSAKTYGYTGGAHGSPGFAALLWDKRADVRRKPADLFDTAALERAAADAYCRAIDDERHKRRLYPIDASTEDPFSACPKVSEGTLILGSSDRTRFDKLGFLIDPYVAGPFSEGTYEVTLPVTPAILAAVSPAFRDAFRVR